MLPTNTASFSIHLWSLCENYLKTGEKKYKIIGIEDKTIYLKETYKSKNFIKNILKIISYISLVFPILALLGRQYFRGQYRRVVIEGEESIPNLLKKPIDSAPQQEAPRATTQKTGRPLVEGDRLPEIKKLIDQPASEDPTRTNDAKNEVPKEESDKKQETPPSPFKNSAPVKLEGKENEKAEGRRPAETVTKKPLKVIFMMGGAGAGKSGVRSQINALRADRNYAVVDMDEIRVQLPEYKALLAGGNSDAANIVHPTCQIKAAELWENFLSEKKNIIYDGTGRDEKMWRGLITEAKGLGYTTKLVYVETSLPTCLKRLKERAKQTGRTVPLSVVEGSNSASHTNFFRLRQFVDSWKHYDNNGAQPVVKSAAYAYTAKKR